MAVILETRKYGAPKTAISLQGHELLETADYRVATENGPGQYRVVSSAIHGNGADPLFWHYRTLAIHDGSKRVDLFYPHGSTVGLHIYNPAHPDSKPLDTFAKTTHRYDSPDGMHLALHDLQNRLQNGAKVHEVAEMSEQVAQNRLAILQNNPQSSSALGKIPSTRLAGVVRKSVIHGLLLADQVRMLKTAESASYTGARNPLGAIQSVARALTEIVPDARRHPGLLRVATSTLGLSWDSHQLLLSQLQSAAEGNVNHALSKYYYRK